MSMNPFPYDGSRPVVASDEAVAGFFQRVYMWMAIGLAVTGLVAFVVASTPALWPILFTKPTVYLVIFSPLLVVLGMSFAGDRLSSTVATGLFMLLSALYGLTFGALFLIYTGGSIARAFLITGGTFGALSVYGMTTKRNLSAMGQFFMMGVIGLIIAGVVNIFMQSDALSFAISAVSVVVFSGLTAYKTQELRQIALASGGVDGESMKKVAIFGALSLYITFINLFSAILRLTGSRR